MKGIKRILCAILTLVMCLGSFTAIYAEDEKQLSDKMSQQIEVLRLFGFITDYYDYNTVTSEYVSRADFARMVAKIINAQDYSGEGQYYYDVPKNHYAYGSISTLTEMGILNGVEEKIFDPERPIELSQVYKILLTLMNYDVDAEFRGGYPSGYMRVASELDLKVMGPADSKVTRGEMFTIVYEAMKTDMMAVKFENGNKTTYVQGDKTLLSYYHDIYYDKGILNSVAGMSLDGEIPIESDDIKIGDTDYKTNLILQKYIGEEVEFFYHKNDDDEPDTVLWAKTTGKTNVLELNAEEIDGFDKDNFTLKYTNSRNTARNVKIDRGITVIYNGREVGSKLDEIFNLPEYSVKLILDGNTAVSAIIEKPETIAVGSINTTNFKVYDKINQTTSIDLDENNYRYLSIEEFDGSKKAFEDIKVGMVLSIYRSLDNSYVKVVMSSLSVEGKIESISQEDKGTEIFISGGTYLLPSTSVLALPKSGDDVKLYLDGNNRIAYIEYLSGSSVAVYIYRGTYDENENEAILKVLHQNGKCMTLTCASKVVVDGKSMKKAEDVIAALNEERNDKSSSFKPQIALITMNKDSEVTTIDTAYVDPTRERMDNSLSVNMPYGAYTYKWTGFLGGSGVINSSTLIFSVPDPSKTTVFEEEFSVKSKADLIDATGYMLETYKTKEKIGYEQLAVMRSKGEDGIWDINVRPFLVGKVETVVNSDDEVVEALTGYNSTEASTFMGAEGVSFSDVKKGMLLRIKQNDKKEITDYEILFDPQNDIDADGKITEDKLSKDSQFGNNYGIVRGYVNDVVDGVIKIGRSAPDVAEQFADKQGAPILIYDADSKSISAGGFEDARTYYKDGNDCSIVIMQSYQGTPKMFVIYNR